MAENKMNKIKDEKVDIDYIFMKSDETSAIKIINYKTGMCVSWTPTKIGYDAG
jgi:hypothetical protein